MKIELKELLEVHTELLLKEKLNNIDIKKELEATNKEIEVLKHALFAAENTINNYEIFTKTINEIISDSKSSSLKSKLLCEIEEYNLDDMVFDSEIKEK